MQSKIDDMLRDAATRLKRSRDFGDLQDENAGRETGKIRRFVAAGNDLTAVRAREHGYSWTADLIEQMRLNRIADRLDELDRASARALELALKREREARETLEQIQSQAMIVQGRRAYRTADGRHVYYEDGTRVEEQVARDSTRPTWEQYQDANRHVDTAVEERKEIEDYRDRLDRTRSRVQGDDGEPLNKDDLDAIDKELEAMPDSVRKQLRTTSAMKQGGPTTQFAFNGAVDGNPEPEKPGETAPAQQPARPWIRAENKITAG